MVMQPIEDFEEEIVGDDDDYETGNGTFKYHIKILLNLNFTICFKNFQIPNLLLNPCLSPDPQEVLNPLTLWM